MQVSTLTIIVADKMSSIEMRLYTYLKHLKAPYLTYYSSFYHYYLQKKMKYQ
ncbi:hypothetical protein DOT_4009 [Desulfosporosinus sp. OT]|nr:hypothetical protein DOT_4009 [Desulfosporosinus sp. OT]